MVQTILKDVEVHGRAAYQPRKWMGRRDMNIEKNCQYNDEGSEEEAVDTETDVGKSISVPGQLGTHIRFSEPVDLSVFDFTEENEERKHKHTLIYVYFACLNNMTVTRRFTMFK